MTGRQLGIAWITGLLLGAPGWSASDADAPPWWLTPQRMIQTNLREIDATMDIDRYVRDIKAFGANVVLFNVGGIVANYPTKHPTHWKNTFMEGDLVGRVLRRLHREDIRMIGRFDFSKVNEAFAKDHPEWLYVSEKDEHVNYNGQVHTCASGPYQQEVMFEILGEAVERFPLDGVFFNMIGYPRSDYSGNYHGLCQCENCREAFKKITGMVLPETADENDPAYKKYGEFVKTMKDRQFSKVRAFLKDKRPDLCICTYTTVGVDVIRKESNRPLGQGTYEDTKRAKWTLLTSGQRQLANAAVHFMRIPYRHAAVSPYLNARRVWQQMVNGAWLDFYCIGPLQRQEDRSGLDVISGIYNFHADNADFFLNTESAAEVGLVNRGAEEFDGIVQVLAENQVPFDLTLVNPDQWRTFKAVIIPDAASLDENLCAAIDGYVESGGKVLLTGAIPAGLQSFGETKLLETRPREKGAYIRIRPEDRARLNHPFLDQLDLVYLSGEFHVYSLDSMQGVSGWLRLIPQDMFGPPEKCYYRVVSDHPALVVHDHGRGRIACFPFAIGTHYCEQSHQGHAALLMGALNGVLETDRRLRVRTHALVEVSHRRDREGAFEWVGLYNHSGHNLNAFHAPISVSDVQIQLTPRREVARARLLGNDQELTVSRRKGSEAISVLVPRLKHYDAVVFEYVED
jgi:hypothetical protein